MTDKTFLFDILPEYSIGAEIGVHLGDFSQQIIDYLSPQELHLIDPWERQSLPVYSKSWYGGSVSQVEMDSRYQSVLNRFADNIQTSQVIIHRNYSSNVLLTFPDNYFDWIYIDGNHLYEYVKIDLELSLRKVKTGGYIAGDDYRRGAWWQGGVKRAVDEFRDNQNVELVKVHNGQFVFFEN